LFGAIALTLILAFGALLEYRLYSIQTVLEALEEMLMPDHPTSSTFTWISGGVTITVTVTKAADESTEHYADRCASEVAVMKTVFPPDP
jgi:hypothetical protein